MLVAHKIIDCINGYRGHEFRIGSDVDRSSLPKLATRIADATKFDFGSLHGERLGTTTIDGEVLPMVRTPSLSDDEIKWWADGFFPLPFPAVWYEFQLIDDLRNCALIESSDGCWVVKFVDYRKKYIACGGAWLRLRLSVNSFDGGGAAQELLYEATFDEHSIKPERLDAMYNLWAAKLRTIICLTIALGNKSSDRRAECAPSQLNKQRQKRGRQPLFDHTVVEILPARFVEKNDELGGTHASPRAHKRRSHLRHLEHQVPGAKLVEWGPMAGKWAIVIPWCWVNKLDARGPLVQTYSLRLEKTDG